MYDDFPQEFPSPDDGGARPRDGLDRFEFHRRALLAVTAAAEHTRQLQLGLLLIR